MLRLTHRRCRAEVAGLAYAAYLQTERAEDLALKNEGLADDLRAAEHQADEIQAACEDVEYAETEAVIPEVLRQRLLDADDRDRLLHDHQEALARIDELTEQRDRTLRAAHEAGMLASVYALMAGSGASELGDAGALMAGLRVRRWHSVPGWGCQGTACTEDIRELVWHTAVPDRAHMACGCGRIWQPGPGAADRAESEMRWRARLGASHNGERPWETVPAPVLEAMDRALPNPDEVREAAADPEAVPA